MDTESDATCLTFTVASSLLLLVSRGPPAELAPQRALCLFLATRLARTSCRTHLFNYLICYGWNPYSYSYPSFISCGYVRCFAEKWSMHVWANKHAHPTTASIDPCCRETHYITGWCVTCQASRPGPPGLWADEDWQQLENRTLGDPVESTCWHSRWSLWSDVRTCTQTV